MIAVVDYAFISRTLGAGVLQAALEGRARARASRYGRCSVIVTASCRARANAVTAVT
jgi:hypothetical protein